MSHRAVLLLTCLAVSATSAYAACETCSPDGRYRLAENSSRKGLVITNEHGNVERALTFPAKDPSTAILRSGWRSNAVVWAEAHVSPYNAIYYEWDVTNGRVLRRIPESQVQVSRDGKHVAWVDVVAANPSPAAEAPLLSIDRTERTIDTRGKVSALAWSPESDELAVAVETDGAVKIVVYNAEGQTTARSLDVPDVKHIRDLHWDERGLIVRSERGEQLIR
jgi:hypothetical protein